MKINFLHFHRLKLFLFEIRDIRHENEANDYANEKLLEVFESLFEKSDCE